MQTVLKISPEILKISWTCPSKTNAKMQKVLGRVEGNVTSFIEDQMMLPQVCTFTSFSNICSISACLHSFLLNSIAPQCTLLQFFRLCIWNIFFWCLLALFWMTHIYRTAAFHVHSCCAGSRWKTLIYNALHLNTYHGMQCDGFCCPCGSLDTSANLLRAFLLSLRLKSDTCHLFHRHAQGLRPWRLPYQIRWCGCNGDTCPRTVWSLLFLAPMSTLSPLPVKPCVAHPASCLYFSLQQLAGA